MRPTCAQVGPPEVLSRWPSPRQSSTRLGCSPWPWRASLLCPCPWVYAFYQNTSVLVGSRESRGVAHGLRLAWRQTWLRGSQCIPVLAILGLFATFVTANMIMAILMPAWLAKTFLGVETMFSRGGFSPANSTFLAVALAVTYLFVDPLVKAFFTLRCFYGQSVRSGAGPAGGAAPLREPNAGRRRGRLL